MKKRDEDKQIKQMGLWAALAIITIVVIIFWSLTRPITGEAIYHQNFVVHDAAQACYDRGCMPADIWAPAKYPSPPSVGCICNNQLIYIPMG